MKQVLLLLVLFCSHHYAKAQFTDTIAPNSAVIDNDSFFSPDQHALLQQLADSLFIKDSTRLFVVIKDTASQEIMPWTKNLFAQWNLNQNGFGRSVLFVYLYKRKGLRIEASHLVINELGKQFAKDVLTYTVIPKMQKRKDFEAVYDGCQLIYYKLINNSY